MAKLSSVALDAVFIGQFTKIVYRPSARQSEWRAARTDPQKQVLLRSIYDNNIKDAISESLGYYYYY